MLHKDTPNDLQKWLLRSPNHFYASFHFSSTEPRSWNDRKSISYRDIPQCEACLADRKANLDLEDSFIKSTKKFNIFDPFAGVGALGRGVEEAMDFAQATHCVEISPSASETLR